MVISKLTLLEFQEKLEENELKSLNKGFEIKDKININSDIANWDFREIRNVEFSELVSVSKVEIASGLAFINCKFRKGIVFRTLDSRKFDTSINRFNTSILFSNCEALQITFASLCKLDRGISIENNSRIGIIRFHETVIKNHGFNLRDSTIERTLDISQVKSEIKIFKSTIGDIFRVENFEGNVSLIKSIFKGWVKFWACKCKNSFVLNYNTFENTFNLEGSEINTFSTIGDTFRKAATIENRDTSGNNLETKLNSFYISEATIVETFELDGVGKAIREIKLPLTPILRGVLRVINWKVKELRLSGVNENLKLLISQCDIQRLIAIDFTNISNVSFDRCKGVQNIFPNENEVDSSFIAAHSDFGNTKFNEFGFDDFNVVRFDNVSLNDISASNIRWFTDRQLLIGDGESINPENFRRRREIYRQLKNALKKTGNHIDSLEFQAREIRTLRNEKMASERYGLDDRLIMLTNISNNYGLNWLKPLGLIVLITISYYLLIIPLLSTNLTYIPSMQCENLKFTFQEIWSKKGVLFQLFNPARRHYLVYGDNGGDWLYLWDALHRMVLGILIFQIIRAFRKYYSK